VVELAQVEVVDALPAGVQFGQAEEIGDITVKWLMLGERGGLGARGTECYFLDRHAYGIVAGPTAPAAEVARSAPSVGAVAASVLAASAAGRSEGRSSG
jgi:hypothetical protein